MASAFARLGMNVIFHLCPPVAPYRIAADQPSAIAWAVQRLEEVGLGECAQRVRRKYALDVTARAG